MKRISTTFAMAGTLLMSAIALQAQVLKPPTQPVPMPGARPQADALSLKIRLLQKQITNLEIKRQRLLRDHTANSPEVKAVNRQIATAESKLAGLTRQRGYKPGIQLLN